MKKRSKIILICIFIIFVATFIAAFGKLNQINQLQKFKEANGLLATDMPSYTLISNQKYINNGKPCMGYHVVVNPNISNEEIYKVFYHICDDNYYLHTVWFFSSAKKAEKSFYDVAMVEEIDKSKWATISRP